MRSKKLLRQIKKTLGTEDLEGDLQQLVKALQSGSAVPNPELWVERFIQLSSFLDSVESSYSQSETMLDLANRSLEVSTKELYDTNEKFRFANKAITAMVNSLDEGFLVIDRNGICGQIFSLAAKNFLGREPVGEHLTAIFNIPTEDRESFCEWLNMLFNEVIEFEDLLELAPKHIKSAVHQHQIEIKFKPIRSPENNQISELVIILIDISERIESERKLGEQKLFTEMVIKYLNNKPNFIRMIQMTRETANMMRSWIFGASNSQEQLNLLYRELHTLKGGLNSLSIFSIGYKVHQIEDQLQEFNKTSFCFNDFKVLIVYLGGELLETLDQFLNKYRRILNIDNKTMVTKEIPANNIYRFSSELLKKGHAELLKIFTDEVVAIPVASLFATIESNLYTHSLSQDKSIDFNIVDPHFIRVIPEFYYDLFEQMVHIFNNILEHGIETIAERKVLKKPLSGQVVVHLDFVENPGEPEKQLQMTIKGDGRGINPATIRSRLSQKGIDTSSETDEQVIFHIFDQGFSTLDSVSLTSGRGVGMASVLSAVQNMNGRISVESKLGRGTQFEIIVPYINELNKELIERYHGSTSLTDTRSFRESHK